MRIRLVAAAVALVAGTTTSFFGGRYDPPHDEDALVAELAKVEPSHAIPDDVHLPEVQRARVIPRGRVVGEAHPTLQRDTLDVALSPTKLSVNGREVLRVPSDLSRGIAPLHSSGYRIVPLDEAVAWESRILQAAGGKASYANLFIDESTPYEAVLQLVRAIDLSPRFVVRTRSTGMGYVSFVLGNAYRNEFAPPVTLRGAEVEIAGTHFPPIEGRVDQVSVSQFFATAPGENFRDMLAAFVYGAPSFVDLVSLLATLDEISNGREPQWTVCREHPDCFRGVLFGNRTGLAPGEVGPIDEARMKLAW